LEITILTALLTLQDLIAAKSAPSEPQVVPSLPPAQTKAPSPPPRPAPKTGIDRIAEMHAMRYEPTEVMVNEEGSVENYGEYAEGLLAVRHTRASNDLRFVDIHKLATGRCDVIHHCSL
jgi:hypothetical protein